MATTTKTQRNNKTKILKIDPNIDKDETSMKYNKKKKAHYHNRHR